MPPSHPRAQTAPPLPAAGPAPGRRTACDVAAAQPPIALPLSHTTATTTTVLRTAVLLRGKRTPTHDPRLTSDQGPNASRRARRKPGQWRTASNRPALMAASTATQKATLPFGKGFAFYRVL